MATGCGVDVVVEDLLDPWSTTTVRADGLVEWTSTIEAERSQTPDGQWVPVDASFEPADGGRIGLVAPAISMSFSDGTDGEPLAVLGKNGHEMVYGMPFDLPKPRVDAAARQLVYPKVLEGVDLIVTVSADGSGFSEVLRIESPQALEQPGMANLVIPVDLDESLAWDQHADGSLRVVDEAGETVFVTPPPVVWDSAADELPGATAGFSSRLRMEGLVPLGAPLAGSGRLDADRTDDAILGQWTVPDRTRAPLDGDGSASLNVQITGDGDDLGLTIDDELAETATYPLYVDPSVSGNLNLRAYVQSAYPNTAHVNDDTRYPIGRCDTRYCTLNKVTRTFLDFNGMSTIGALASDDILSATLTAYGDHSFSCTAKTTRLLWTQQTPASPTWSNQPAYIAELDAKAYAHSKSCGNQRDVTFNATRGAQEVANANTAGLSLALAAANESVMDEGWKYYGNFRLSVTYSRVPAAATGQKVNGVAACGTSSAPTWVTTATPTFSWVVADPDGGKVTGNFDFLKAGAMVWDAPETQTLASGSTFSVAVPSGHIAENTVYEWRSGGKDTQGRPSPYGPMKSCYIKADLTNPGLSGVTATGVTENQVVPKPASASFTISNASTDVVGYKVGFDVADPVTAMQAAGANRTLVVNAAPVNLTPGSHTFVVRAVDAAGRTSGVKTFRYSIARASVAAYWTMNDPSAVIPDWSPSAVFGMEGSSQVLVFSPNPAREPGVYAPYGFEDDRAVSLNGSQSGVAQEGVGGAVAPVVSSASAFTVTAYVKAGSVAPAGPGAVVSQDGSRSSSFALVQATSGCPAGLTSCWAFTRSTTDDDAGAGAPVRVTSEAPVTPGLWQLLVARYTPGVGTAVGKMELTVCDEGSDPLGRLFLECGTPEGVVSPGVTAVHGLVPVPTWEAQGALRVGQQIVKNAAGGYVPGNGFVGLVDDVRVYKTALTEADIARIASGSDQAP